MTSGRPDVERRLVAVERGRGLHAARDDAERKTADALRAAGIDAAERRLAIDPAGQRAVGNRGGVVPQPAPADRREMMMATGAMKKRPQPPAARHGGTLALPAAARIASC